MKKILLLCCLALLLPTSSAFADNPYNSPCGGAFSIKERIVSRITFQEWRTYLQCAEENRDALREQAIADGTLPIGCAPREIAVETGRDFALRMVSNGCALLGNVPNEARTVCIPTSIADCPVAPTFPPVEVIIPI